MAGWNKVNKPTGDGFTKIAKPTGSQIPSYSGGDPIGLLLALTYSTVTMITSSAWNPISKPTTDGFTKVPKPTT